MPSFCIYFSGDKTGVDGFKDLSWRINDGSATMKKKKEKKTADNSAGSPEEPCFK